MKLHRINNCAFIASAVLVSSCVSGGSDPNQPNYDFSPVIYKSEADLDKSDISILKTGPFVVKGFEGISGRVLDAINLVTTDMKQKFPEQCGENPIINHHFFYEEGSSVIRIITVERTVPDDENQIRDYFDKDGEKQIAVPLYRGARFLPGCSVEYHFDEKTRNIEFQKFHR